MNGNGEQQQNALSVALSEINSCIFEIGEVIPNGIYLEMMNNSKKVFDEIKILEEDNEKMKEKIENRGSMTITEKVKYITCNEDNMSKLDYVKVGTDDDGKYIDFYERDGSLIICRRIGDYIRIFESGGNYKFMRIDKINKNSIVYSVFRKVVYGRYYKNLNVSLIVKTGEHHIKALRSRNILIYDSSKILTKALFNKVCFIENNEDEIEGNKFLKIDIQ